MVLFFLLIQLVLFWDLWKLYLAAGEKAGSCHTVYNAIILMKIIGRRSWWTILLFIPIINLIMFPIIWVETLSFGNALLWIPRHCNLRLYVYYNYTQN
jgi:signal peptidase I